MRVNVLLFGPQAAIAGRRELPIDLPPDATVDDALVALGDAAPGLIDSLDTSRLAVNHEFAPAAQVLTATDEVALIGMVSGG